MIRLGKIMEALIRFWRGFVSMDSSSRRISGYIYDCQYKATTEYELYQVLRKFSTVVYLSATPYLESYLDMTEQFRNMTVYELLWSEDL